MLLKTDVFAPRYAFRIAIISVLRLGFNLSPNQPSVAGFFVYFPFTSSSQPLTLHNPPLSQSGASGLFAA
ncbi:hypothetical protein [Vibrio sp. V09_P4A23P171]|uniref:hypothetical protein n=1 Tax=Vibrio sp. V09_P4A23P171 TaxID=1938664 RepID=UPI00113FE342|nr:hypothetical protein [Vibrio sp. V09_P4A23P171]